MSDAAPGWKAVGQVSASFLRASAGLALAWGFWEASASKGFELFAYIAAVGAIVFIKQAAIGLVQLVQLIISQRKWAGYRRQGATPKADHMAGDAELRKRGLM